MVVISLNPLALTTVATVLLPAAQAGPVSVNGGSLAKRQLVSAIPGCSSDFERKFQPAFDFDTDACYNAPAISADGTLNPGYDTCYDVHPGEKCSSPNMLVPSNNNVYVRRRCNNGWCAQVWGYYFETDSKANCQGHRHDWEHVVTWFTTNDSKIKYVSASVHGGWDVKAASDVQFDGDHPKIVYHKTSGSTHALRHARPEDDNGIENSTGGWFYGTIVDYHGFPSDELRNKMLSYDWGQAMPNIREAGFSDVLKAAMGGNDIALDTTFDDEGSSGRPC